MLELKNIKKVYQVGENELEALKGISLTLRDSEFVSILGPSGCGKTTTLNIIGGLDRYTDGDLLIENKSTKTFKDKEWDQYRNHKVGFVFQSYNLIPHQNILSNVEIALTIGNVDKNKRKDLAIDALKKVGLENEMYKFPRQLSGGQMQRVAIARAIVNNPTVLLADEPTGALDSKTSIQVLDILKELSKDCLVVMVTHNEDLANKYSTRIISLSDGAIINDTNPYNPSDDEKEESVKKEIENNKKYLDKKGNLKKVKMPFKTALKLSLSNLKSKIGRTLLTCFAGSIGIIGIALILSVSNGFDNYIDDIEKSTLSEYPITLTESTLDMTSLMAGFMIKNKDKTSNGNVENDKVTPNYVMVDLLRSLASATDFNDLKSFKVYLDDHIDEIKDNILQVKYNYNVDLNIYNKSLFIESNNKKVTRLSPFDIPDYYDEEETEPVYIYSQEYNATTMEQMMSSMEVWSEMYEDVSILENQYDLLSGKWATEYNEVVLVLDQNNQMSDFCVYAAGLADDSDKYLLDLFRYINGEIDEDPTETYKDKYVFNYEDLIGQEYYLIPSSMYYQKDDVTGTVPTYTNIKDDNEKLKELFLSGNENLLSLKVVGIIRPNPNSDTHSISGAVGYTKKLVDKIIEINNNSQIVKDQHEYHEYCLINFEGLSTKGMKWTEIQDYMKFANQMQAGTFSQSIIDLFSEEVMVEQMLKTYFGEVDKSNPSSISIYPKSFEDKDVILEFINVYNNTLTEEEDDKRITYHDYIGAIMGSATTIINAVTYVLIAFVSISLIVSSIMIAIITYISVLERTKEIGILRAMGASKTDVKNIFNAETFITGLIAGVLGIVITLLLNIPLSLIIENLSGIENMANLPIYGGVALIIISFTLSLVSGLIPSGYAAKCDPVVALRSE